MTNYDWIGKCDFDGMTSSSAIKVTALGLPRLSLEMSGKSYSTSDSVEDAWVFNSASNSAIRSYSSSPKAMSYVLVSVCCTTSISSNSSRKASCAASTDSTVKPAVFRAARRPPVARI